MARCLPAALMALLPLALLAQEPAREPPREWIDPDTGHRVIRLSEEPGSQSLSSTRTATRPTARRWSSRHRLVGTVPGGSLTIMAMNIIMDR